MCNGAFARSVGIMTGILAGGAAEALAALIGGIRGGAEEALRWAQCGGLLVGTVGIWLLLRRLMKAEGPQIWRPGRTWLEMEYEVEAAHKKDEKALRDSGGEEHRMPWRQDDRAALWMIVGLLISVFLPATVNMLLS